MSDPKDLRSLDEALAALPHLNAETHAKVMAWLRSTTPLDVKVTLTGPAAAMYRAAEEARAARDAQVKRDLPCRIFDTELGVEFRLSGEPHEGEIYRVEVEVFAACAATDGTVLYPFAEPPYSTNEPTCEPELRISVKWDGCTDWRTPCYHTCCRKDLERVSRILVRAYELAGERITIGFEGD